MSIDDIKTDDDRGPFAFVIGSAWPQGTTFTIDGKPAEMGDVIPDGALVEARIPGKVDAVDLTIKAGVE